jgi:hypothetical protein
MNLYGTTLENLRAAFAPSDSCPPGFMETNGNLVCPPAGEFTSSYNPANPVDVVARNYLTMAGLVSINLRVYRVFGVGPRLLANGTAEAAEAADWEAEATRCRWGRQEEAVE